MALSITNVALLSGVPFSNDYNHTKYFSSIEAQESYFKAQTHVHSMAQTTYQRQQGTGYIRVDAPIDTLRVCNYGYYNNAGYTNKTFYFFVTDLEYKNDGTTIVFFEIDVLQSYYFNYTLQPSMIERSHFTDDRQFPNGIPWKMSQPENLSVGDSLTTLKSTHIKTNELEYQFLVIVSKEAIHVNQKEIVPSYIGCPQPLSYYIVPFHRYRGSQLKVHHKQIAGGTQGTETITIGDPIKILKQISEEEDFVNEIVALFVTDYFGLPFTTKEESAVVDSMNFFTDHTNYDFDEAVLGADGETPLNGIYVRNLREFKPMNIHVTDNLFSGFKRDGKFYSPHSKMMMSPFASIVLSDYRGHSFEYNPQLFYKQGIDIVMRGSLGTMNKVSYSVGGYTFDTSEITDGDFNVISLGNGVIDDNVNDVPVMVDSLSAYMQGNRNSFQNSVNRTATNSAFALTQTGLDTLSAIGGAKSQLKNVKSFAGGKAEKGKDIRSEVNSTGVIDSGRSLANSIYDQKALIAQVKDLDNRPPTLQNLGGNTAFYTGNGIVGLNLSHKVVGDEYTNVLNDYFMQFGMAYNRVETPARSSRKAYHFIKTRGCKIVGKMNQTDIDNIQSIFDNGVTFWKSDDVGNYNVEN